MSNQSTAKKPKRERIQLRVINGGLVPASPYASSLFVVRNYKEGQVVNADITRLRNTKFNRLVHKIGCLCIEHIEAFQNYADAHQVIKRLQIESNAGCDEIGVSISTSLADSVMIKSCLVALKSFLLFLSERIGLEITEDGMLILRLPRSLSFESMDEDEYQDVAKQICRHIADRYWPDLTPERIRNMAECMVDE